MPNLQQIANKRDACKEAVVWLKSYDDPKSAWNACERGDWMLWWAGQFAGRPGDDKRRPLVLAACECVRLALPFVKKGEARPLAAIEMAERWARREGDVSLEDVRKAADAAYAATYADAAYADATYAAAYGYAAYAAYAAADAAADVAYAAAAYARKDTLKQCADIVRKHYPNPPEAPDE